MFDRFSPLVWCDITSALQANELIGCGSTYTLFEYAKENMDSLLESQPEVSVTQVNIYMSISVTQVNIYMSISVTQVNIYMHRSSESVFIPRRCPSFHYDVYVTL